MSGKFDLLNTSNSLKVLSFIAGHPGENLLAKEIQKATGISGMGVYLALKELEAISYVEADKKGKSFTYRLNHKNPQVKQFKTLKNVMDLSLIVEKLKEYSGKIILFGSAARGEDGADSDYDLFITTEDKESAEEALKKFKSGRKIQAKFAGAVELADIKKNDAVFYNEVMRGITLWENEK